MKRYEKTGVYIYIYIYIYNSQDRFVLPGRRTFLLHKMGFGLDT